MKISSNQSQVTTHKSPLTIPSPPAGEGLGEGSNSLVTSHKSQPSWYVIKTKPCEEDLVAKRLAKANFEVFYPRIKSVVRGRGKSHVRLKSLFPTYIFSHLNFNDPKIYHMIKYTRGVHRILGNGVTPVPIPDVVIKVIMERVNSEGVLEQQLVFKKGDSVSIKRGPLKDLIGILEKPVSDAGRARIFLRVMNKIIRAELSCTDIERVSE